VVAAGQEGCAPGLAPSALGPFISQMPEVTLHFSPQQQPMKRGASFRQLRATYTRFNASKCANFNFLIFSFFETKLAYLFIKVCGEIC